MNRLQRPTLSASATVPTRMLGYAVLVAAFVGSGTARAQCDLARLVASDAQDRDRLGTSVALSGDWGLVGAPLCDDQALSSGAAYVAHRGPGGWDLVDKLLASDGAEERYFGTDVSIDGDWALIGSDFGAYVFQRTAGGWTETQRLVGSDTLPEDDFGRTVELLGDVALVSAPRRDLSGDEDVGSVYVFERAGNVWSESAILEPYNGRAEDYFGTAVALGPDVAIIGAPEHDLHGFHSKGVAYVFERTTSGWEYDSRIFDYFGGEYDRFGGAIGLDGDRAAVIASGLRSIFIFQRTPTGWQEESRFAPTGPYGISLWSAGVILRGDRLLTTGYGSEGGSESSGRAFLFKQTSTGWRYEQDVGDNRSQSWLAYGTDIAASGDTILVGARGSGDICDNHECRSGAAYLYDWALSSATNFCTANSNSSGAEATLSLSGCTSFSSNSMSLQAHPVPTDTPGLIYYGDRALSPIPFGDGLRCVGGRVYRLGLTHADGNVLASSIDLSSTPSMVNAGTTWYFQAYFRDVPAGASGFNLSDAIEVVFQN